MVDSTQQLVKKPPSAMVVIPRARRMKSRLVVANVSRPRLSHEPASVLEHSGLLHHVGHGAVQRAALRGEVVLELDQHDGGSLRIDRHGRYSRQAWTHA